MDPAFKFTVLLVLLGLASTSLSSSPTKDDLKHCKRIVEKWKFSALDIDIKEDRQTLRDLLFFLHVPRTGGRSYFHCFLEKLYSSELECPRPYEKLKFDPSKTNCRLLVTHDDYSMMTKLPRERTSVVTNLMNPIDRVFSTYEFSVEVAARFLVHPNLTRAIQMYGPLRAMDKGVSTLDIWPWKYLVPWMREDLFARRDARNREGHSNVKRNNSYNMEEIVMPLHVYINDPITLDIIHNGATFQVAGLTNDSYLGESHEIRHCVQKYQDLGFHVLEVAKKRLNDMLYVGLTEDHRESATMFGNMVGAQVISQLIASSSHMELAANNKSETSPPFSNSEHNTNHLNNSTDQKASELGSADNFSAIKENLTVAKLMEAYDVCVPSLRKTHDQRRALSFERIYPVNFSKEARRQVPDAVLQQIKSLNWLDLELYKHAQDIFAKQHKHTTQKLVAAEKESTFNHPHGASFWEVPLIALSIVFISLFLYANVRRRKSKLKL